MSLSLIQSYSSAEEEEHLNTDTEQSSDEEQQQSGSGSEPEPASFPRNYTSLPNNPNHSTNSLLPSALDAFSEVAGPPQFLSSATAVVAEKEEATKHVHRRGRNRYKRDKKDLPLGVVLEAKAQLVGIRDRVRSDMEGGSSSTSASNAAVSAEGGKRVISAANPEAKDAADLLRMCVQCSVPKTYSHSRGMVCPICGDRPLADPLKESEKKKGSTIKDKEKNKRMKGQSSHASWKSETEMQLRQQFD